ncbi:MAG TPA: hypothetical protein VGI55_11645, partial [Solirubrobacteraceae bacterium]
MPDRRAPYSVTLGTAVAGTWPVYPLETVRFNEMASTPRTEEEEDEYELTPFGRVVIPVGGLLVRLDGGPEPSEFRGWAALVKRLARRYLALLLGIAGALVVAAAVVVYLLTRTAPNPSTTAAARLALTPS